MNAIKKPVAAIKGKRIILRELTLEDVTDRYVCWMNDPEITQYLESRFRSFSGEDLIGYIREKKSDPDSALFAICLLDTDVRIGNIKLGPVHWRHRLASIGILIGEKEHFGNGFATEAIGLLAEYGFRKLNLHKLTAGCYVKNIGARKAFEKNGFTVEGVRKDHVLFQGRFMDIIELGAINLAYQQDG